MKTALECTMTGSINICLKGKYFAKNGLLVLKMGTFLPPNIHVLLEL